MGGALGKPKNPTTNTRTPPPAPLLKPTSNSSKKPTAVVPVTNQEVKAKAQSEDHADVISLLAIMSSTGLPRGVITLFLAYWNFDLPEQKSVVETIAEDKTLRDMPVQTFTIRWGFLGEDQLPIIMAKEAAKNVIWGFPDKVEEIITAHSRCLNIPTSATDHIDTVYGCLYQIALKIKDNQIQNRKKNGETMVTMLERHVRTKFGEEEVKRQKDEVRPFLEAEAKRNSANQVVDVEKFETVWRALDGSPAKNAVALLEDKDLKGEVDLFERHLKESPGDWAVLIQGEQKFVGQYLHFNGYNSIKNNFFEDRILRLIQLCRLRAWELQVLDFGLIKCRDAVGEINFSQVDVPRSDVKARFSLGVVLDWLTGDYFSLDVYGRCGAAQAMRGWREGVARTDVAVVGKLFTSNNIKLGELLSDPSSQARGASIQRGSSQ